MRIFYINVIQQNAGWGAETFVDRGFNRLGHKTYCVDFRENRNHLYGLLLKAPESDVFLLQRGDYFPLPVIKAIQVPRFFWASELVSRCRDQDRLLKSGLFDHIFLHTHDCLETVVKWGWVEEKKCSVLLNGFDETLHRKMPELPRDIDILFVGSLTQRRKQLLALIQSRFKVTVASAFGKEQVPLFNRAKIVLNIHAEDYLDTETRIFEVLGCGAFLLSERLSAENPFTPDELVQYKTTDDLFEKLQYYLSHDEARNAIADAGHKAALARHTYIQRAAEIVEIMSANMPHSGKRPEKLIKQSWSLRLYGASEPMARVADSLARSTRRMAHTGKTWLARLVEASRAKNLPI